MCIIIIIIYRILSAAGDRVFDIVAIIIYKACGRVFYNMIYYYYYYTYV